MKAFLQRIATAFQTSPLPPPFNSPLTSSLMEARRYGFGWGDRVLVVQSQEASQTPELDQLLRDWDEWQLYPERTILTQPNSEAWLTTDQRFDVVAIVLSPAQALPPPWWFAQHCRSTRSICLVNNNRPYFPDPEEVSLLEELARPDASGDSRYSYVLNELGLNYLSRGEHSNGEGVCFAPFERWFYATQ